MKEPLDKKEREALKRLRERERLEEERARRRKTPPPVERGVDTPPRGKTEPRA